jgi:hypothetical protein
LVENSLEHLHMLGIRRYTHAERQQVIEELLPLIQRKFGANLVAVAVSASFARGEDADYSDLELIAFVQRMPASSPRGGMGRIRDGMLVELVWTTRTAYLASTRDVTSNWYIAGSDVLLPLINAPFIEELNRYQVDRLREKCRDQARRHWYEVQESTAKVLNAIEASNHDGLPLLLFDMTLHMLIVLSFLNQTPYVTFARFITQARAFELKPAGFTALLDTVVQGSYQDHTALRATVVDVFSQFEAIFEALGVELYDSTIDPNMA